MGTNGRANELMAEWTKLAPTIGAMEVALRSMKEREDAIVAELDDLIPIRDRNSNN